MTGLQKQPIQLNFAQGLDLKTDPNQVQVGKFLGLQNAVFQNGGGLQKRNGFGNITTVSDTSATGLATLKGNLIATGSVLQAYSATTDTWLNRGTIQPVSLAASSIIRSNTGQSKPDVAVNSMGQVCSVFVDSSSPYYIVTDLATEQVIVSRTALPSTATTPRVFCLDNHFVIVFGATVTAAPHLQFIAIPYLDPSNPTAASSISTTISAIGAAMDGAVVDGTLYLAYNGNDGGGAIRMNYINSALTVSSVVAFAGKAATSIAVCADSTPSTGSGPFIWVASYDSATNKVHNMAVDTVLNSLLAFTEVFTGVTATHVTAAAQSSSCTTFIDNQNSYSFTGRTDYVSYNTCTQAGVAGTAATLVRSVQLGSKAFIDSGVIYFWGAYETPSTGYQNTYFLINSSGKVVAKLAQGNGGGYYTDQKLPSVTSDGSSYYVGYLYKASLAALARGNGATNNSIYSVNGLNLCSFSINASAQYHEEIADSLHLTGGFLWQYDGAIPVEHSFHLWPDAINVTAASAGASGITSQVYYYIATYEWTDANGLLHRSAGSLPVTITPTAGYTVTVKVPTLRLTAKVSPNPVRVVLYRYSAGQPVYYQVSSIPAPTANDTTTDSVSITDTAADIDILGNTILYTTGSVVENIAAPAVAAATLFRNRLVTLDAENRNLLWYSKQVIDQTPVEMSDLFTIYVAPTASAQGPTGPVTALSSMDDKLIIFKRSAIYYVTGNGPDNTGANNDFSEPVYITGTVGTSNPKSVVFTPIGIMFSSDKGIWLLGRDLSTKYIGADVESYNSHEIVSAMCIPGTNQVRFALDNGEMLMYDYYYNQWGTFSGIETLDSVLYDNKHTYLAAVNGLVRQETPGEYLDGSTPVLLSFTTAWVKLTGLQGFQRAYFLYLLSEYVTPHKLNVQISYDYGSSSEQTVLITPAQLSNSWGSDSTWGSSVSWGLNTMEQNRIFLSKQKCQAIQVTVDEVYDSSQGIAAGAGFTMSSMLLVIGAKLGYAKLPASNSNG